MFIEQLDEIQIKEILQKILSHRYTGVKLEQIKIQLDEDNTKSYNFLHIDVVFSTEYEGKNIKRTFSFGDFSYVIFEESYINNEATKFYRKIMFDIFGNNYAITYLLGEKH